MSKGSKPRPVNKERYDANYEAIFGVKEPTSGGWNPDSESGLVRNNSNPTLVGIKQGIKNKINKPGV